MDPTGSAIGTASLGIEVCRGLLSYFNRWKSSNSDVSSTYASIENLSKTLALLKSSLDGNELDEEKKDYVKRCLYSCKESLVKLSGNSEKLRNHGQLENLQQRTRVELQRLLYPFGDSTLTNLREIVTDLQERLRPTEQVLQLDVGTASQRIVNSMAPSASDEVNRTVAIETYMSAQTQHILTLQKSDQFERIQDWLSPPVPWTNHKLARLRHKANTNTWLLYLDQYQRWKAGDIHHLWLYGRAGCGKTILCSTVIEDIRGYCDGSRNSMYAFFYFSFSDTQKQSYNDFLRSVVAQLGRKETCLSMLVKAYQDPGANTLIVDELESIALACIQSYDEFFLLLDALDECPETEEARWNVLDCLGRLAREASNLKVFATSRDLRDIHDGMELLGADVIRMDRQADDDIRQYVESVLLHESRLAGLDADLKGSIKETLTAGADGMFRLVFLQLEELKKLKSTEPKYVQATLASLPTTLGAIYERMLIGIGDTLREDALVLLRWLAYSQNPLSLSELEDATIIDLGEEETVEKGDRGGLENTLESLSGFVTIVERANDNTLQDLSDRDWERTDSPKDNTGTGGDHQRPRKETKVRLAHLSVMEYLESSAILQSDVKDFHLQSAREHRHLAQSCLKYLTQYNMSSEKRSGYEDFENFPLLQYAARSWFYHSSLQELGDVSREVSILNSKDTMRDWLLIHQPDRDWEEPFKVSSNLGAGLYYASFLGLKSVVEELIMRGADITAQGGVFGTALQAASDAGHEKVVQMLIEAGANVNAHGGVFGTALHAASYRGYEKVVQMLMEAGADVNAQGGVYNNPYALQTACDRGYEEIVRLLLNAGANTHAKGGFYGNALQVASNRGYKRIVELLLEAGANVNAQGGFYGNALQAASNGGYKGIVQLLLEAGADANKQAGYYQNALQAACAGGNVTIARLLTANGADVNAEGGEYGNALCAASYGGHRGIIRLLLDRGANVHIHGARYGNPLQAACAGGHPTAVRLLLDCGANVESTAETGETPLQAACVAGATEIVNLLLEHRADTNAPPGSHGTALRAAALHGAQKIVSKLLRCGADPVPEILQNGDALFVASRGGFKAIVQELLTYGADPNTSYQAVSAIQAARREGHSDVVNILLNAGAVDSDLYEPPLNKANASVSDIGQLIGAQRLIPDNEDNSDMETMPESVFSPQEFSVTSRPTTTTSIVRNDKHGTIAVGPTAIQSPTYASLSTRHLHVERGTAKTFLDRQIKPEEASKDLHSTISGGALPTQDMSPMKSHSTTLQEEQQAVPLTLDEALTVCSIPQITTLLDQHLDMVATGSWDWLPELFELGFDALGVAKLLLEQETQQPFVYFKPWAEKGRQPQENGHLQNCVHGGGEIRGFEEGQFEEGRFDLRATVTSLCGVAGIVPDTGGESAWNGRVEFDDSKRASVSFCMGEDEINDMHSVLSRTTNALDGFCSGAAEFQARGSCCDRYTYLCAGASQKCGDTDALQLNTMPLTLSMKLLESLKRTQEDSDDPLLLDICVFHARTILKDILPSKIDENPDTTSSWMKLHYCALAVQFLCLSFASYCQAHVGAIRFFFLEHELSSALLNGAPHGFTTQLCPTVWVDLRRLTCLDSMLNNEVIVFSPALRSDRYTPPKTGPRYDVVATLEDVVDTWGPAGLIFSQDNSSSSMVSGILIRGGSIQGIDGRWHWSSDSGPEEPPTYITSLTEPLRIGALITRNPFCNADEMHCLSTADGYRDQLGSYDEFWIKKQRQAGLSAGQYFNVQFIYVFEKDLGRTLKMEKVESLYRILTPSSSDQLLPFLKSSCGVQVSFCSGLARRVEMRELFADILPTWMQRKTPCPGQWKALRDTHQVIQILRQGDLYNWICRIFEHDRGCYKLFCEAVVDITNELVPTGVDKSGEYFVVAWITSQREISTQCIKVPVKDGSFWTRALQDSSDCATFAYLTMDCLQFRGQGCRSPDWRFPFGIRLVETEVHRHFDIPQAQVAARSHSQWTLQHHQVYAIGKLQSDAILQLRALVSRPTSADDPRLVVKPRHIPNGIWLRALRQKTEPGRLRERTTPLDSVQKVIISSTVEI